jgi:ABC-type amino acid transport substrate-binding protein
MRLFIPLALTLCFSQAAQAQSLDARLLAIKQSGTLRIAYRADSRPFSYLDEAGRPTGYTVELCLAVARDLEQSSALGKLAIDWVEVDATTRFDVMVRGEADLECGSTTVSLSRMARVDFSNLIFVDTPASWCARRSPRTAFVMLATAKWALSRVLPTRAPYARTRSETRLPSR